ncbi:MAG: hypothetical protein KC646_17035 [Candidatus Cloacimonetes bacterium]|nr:hypothetical protein [Candidatus Cloacimonadota bacterium]
MDQTSQDIVKTFVEKDWVTSYYTYYNTELDKKTERMWRHNDVSNMIEKEIYFTKIAINIGKVGIAFSIVSLFIFATILVGIIVFGVSCVLMYESKRSLADAEKRKAKFKGTEEEKLKKRPVDSQIVLDFFCLKMILDIESLVKSLTSRKAVLEKALEESNEDEDIKQQLHYCGCAVVVMVDVQENIDNSVSNLKKQVFAGGGAGDPAKEDAMVKSLIRYIKNLEEHIVDQLL